MNIDLQREQSLFEAASNEADPGRRRALLEAECAGNPRLLAKIQKLADAHERAEEFFAACVPILPFEGVTPEELTRARA